MTTSSTQILITEGGSGASRAALAAVRLLGPEGFDPVVTVSDPRTSFAARSRHTKRVVEAPRIDEDETGYVEAMEQLLEKDDFLGVLPVTDSALLALKPELAPLVDKERMSERARSVGFLTPPTQIYRGVGALRKAAGSFDYPVIVKPSVKVAAAQRLESASQFDDLPVDETISWMVQPVLQDPMRGLAGVAWEGRLLAATHLRYRRLWPLPCGTVASAYTVDPDLGLETRVASLLENYTGLFHIDLAGQHLLDLNLRPHATLPVAAAAGANVVVIYARALQGDIAPLVRARPGVLFRWLEADIRSTLSEVRNREISFWDGIRFLAPHRNTVHSVWSIDDLRPLWARFHQLRERIPTGRFGGFG